MEVLMASGAFQNNQSPLKVVYSNIVERIDVKNLTRLF